MARRRQAHQPSPAPASPAKTAESTNRLPASTSTPKQSVSFSPHTTMYEAHRPRTPMLAALACGAIILTSATAVTLAMVVLFAPDRLDGFVIVAEKPATLRLMSYMALLVVFVSCVAGGGLLAFVGLRCCRRETSQGVTKTADRTSAPADTRTHTADSVRAGEGSRDVDENNAPSTSESEDAGGRDESARDGAEARAQERTREDNEQSLSTLPPMTRTALARHNGSDADLPLLVAVKGVVFDVTPKAQLYGAGKGYAVLTGRDASCAFAMGSLKEEHMHDRLQGLSPKQLAALDEWFVFFMRRYTAVARLDTTSAGDGAAVQES